MKPWGQHLILDIAGCNDNVRKESAIKAFVKELVSSIDMEAYGEPVIKHFAEHLKDAAGYSMVQLIETSAITGHFSDNNKDAYLDIFSCKSFDNDKVIAVIEKYFSPRNIHMISLSRDAKQPPKKPFIKIK
jgi:S-adenosylmethionine/arginine decarboxylase-like enzyme